MKPGSGIATQLDGSLAGRETRATDPAVADVLIPAEPEAVRMALERTAVLVVDMQNGFARPGGMLDLAGIDVAPAREAVTNARLVCEAARAGRVPGGPLGIGYAAGQSAARG